MDVSRVADCQTALIGAAEALGGIDLLVNNAGVDQVSPAFSVDESLWNRILDTNLKGAFFCAQAAARLMQKAGKPGAILNLCSLTSEIGVPTAVPYGASKSGLLGMTRALAAEWAPIGVRVNALAPGYFRTALTEVFYQDEAWQNAMTNRPGRIKMMVSIDLPRPRRYEMVATTEFQKLHRTVLDAIRSESIVAAGLARSLD